MPQVVKDMIFLKKKQTYLIAFPNLTYNLLQSLSLYKHIFELKSILMAGQLLYRIHLFRSMWWDLSYDLLLLQYDVIHSLLVQGPQLYFSNGTKTNGRQESLRHALSCSFALVKFDGVPLEPAPPIHKRFCQINIAFSFQGK